MSKTKLAHGTKAYVTNKAKDASAAPAHLRKLGKRTIKLKHVRPEDFIGIPKPYDWRDPIMHNLQTDLAVQRKIIDDLRRQEALLRTELQHKNVFIDLLLKERDKS